MKNRYIHIIHILLFAAVTFFYCWPIIDGKVVQSPDIDQFKGMSQEIKEYREDTGNEALWTNSMFSGMPTFHMGVKYPNNILLPIDKFLQLGFPRPIGSIFICFLGFYILLLSLKLDLKIAFLGALAFGLSTYLYIIIAAGHNTKLHAIAYMAPTIAAMIYCYKDKRLLGFLLTFLFLGLQIRANHYQISYYLLFLLFSFFLYELIISIRKREIKNFFKNTAVFSLGCFFAILINISSLWSTYDYSKFSIRGGSEINLEDNKTNQHGLDFEKVTQWSYGKLETFNLIIPNLFGGSSQSTELSNESQFYIALEKKYRKIKSQYNNQYKMLIDEAQFYKSLASDITDKDSSLLSMQFIETAKLYEDENYTNEAQFFKSLASRVLSEDPSLLFMEFTEIAKNIEEQSKEYKKALKELDSAAEEQIKKSPVYWGEQPITLGPVYIGSIVFLLFFLGLIIINDRRIKILQSSYILGWFLFGLTILSIFLSWGHNLGWLSHLFFDYFPLYSKFRSITMILVIVEITIPIIAVIGLSRFLNQVDNNSKEYVDIWKSKLIYLIISFLIVLFICVGFAISGFDFTSSNDYVYLEKEYRTIEENSALIEDRKSLFFSDIWRTLIVVILATSTLLFFLMKKISRNLTIYLIAVFILLDMWFVNKRYFNNDNFVNKEKYEIPFEEDENDKKIKELEKSKHYRVLDLGSPQEKVSYFHKNMLGKHAAGLSRYDDIVDQFFYKDFINSRDEVINMLNVKWINGQENISAHGNSWFVDSIIYANSPQEEFNYLLDYNFSPQSIAIVNNKDKSHISQSKYIPNQFDTIYLTKYAPNELEYKSKIETVQLAVFSEIYYPKGWNAYIDGKKVPHFCVNYILRALEVPKGEHTITFKFEPNSFHVGNNIALASSIIFVLTFISLFFPYFRRKFLLLKK